MLPGLVACAFLHLGIAQAQEVIQDARKFQTPAIFVLPKAPVETLQQFEERTYRVQVAIDDQGTVQGIHQVEPPDAEFRALLDDAARFWVFFPEIYPTRCKTVPSTGVVELTYRRDEKEPRAWLTLATGKRLLEVPAPQRVSWPAAPLYPVEERRKDISGRVYVIGVINPQGEVTDTRLLLGLPPSPGLVRQARGHLRATKFDAGLAPVRCAVVEYNFRLE